MGSADSSMCLAGLRILIVEDDYFVANETGQALREFGAEILGPVPTVARAKEALLDIPDCVLLDINLKGEMAFDLAREILIRGIPIVFMTGYDRSIVPASLQSRPWLQKPVETRELIDTVRREARPRPAR
ncbi:MAG TPA: response regulator [Steroidobacteraceae bacterium]|nr:response regulator [Steroidobacteraceae bacterium]